MSDEQLVPVFMPPLATLLAAAEAQKQAPLTPHEAEQLRDEAVCIMMKAEDAAEMQTSRGYRDVEPEDVWADWHRLRVESTGNGYLPKIVWCLVGDQQFADQARTILEADPVEHEWSAPNPRILPSFLASESRLHPSLTDEEKQAIESHTHVLYLLSPNYTAGEATPTCARYLNLAARLLDKGGAAGMKCESSGLAHGKQRWLQVAADQSLVGAYVQLPIGDANDLWTCGMHLLGRTDIIIGRAVLEDEWETARHLDIFATYLAEECPHFHSGHTFQCDVESPRLRAVWEPCDRYEPDEFFNNPFGRLRLELA